LILDLSHIIMNKLINRLNYHFYKYLYHPKRYIKHPLVSDATTNSTVGIGYGLARSTDPITLLYLFWRYIPKAMWSKSNKKSIIDLGCGDGTVLRLLEFMKLKNLVGVEGDETLSELAKKNSSWAEIINVDFTTNNFFERVYLYDFKVLFAFNPTSAAKLSKVIIKLVKNEPVFLILRNP
jgi:hypothetical protein